MFNKITTIAALSTFAACSTPFDSTDLNGEEKTPSTTSVQSEPFSKTAIDDQVGLNFADVSSELIDVSETEKYSASLNFEDKSEEVGGGDKSSMPQVLTVPESVSVPSIQANFPEYHLAALLSKRVEDELQIRMYPGEDLSVKICLHSDSGDDCFKGETNRFDHDFGGEIAVELRKGAHSYSISVSGDGVEYEAMGPFKMPKSENTWEEEVSCDSQATISNVQYKLYQSDEDETISYVEYHSADATSAMLCGVDQAGDNVCVWDPMSSGEKKMKIRVDSDAGPRDVLIRDHHGCSIPYGPSN